MYISPFSKYSLKAIFLFVVLSKTGCAQFTSTTQNTNTTEYNAQNPIIWADVPDLSIIRVGDTYYMNSTTMHCTPGVPVMKSKNLVNWHIVNYAYDILGKSDALSLENGENAYGDTYKSPMQ